MGTETQGIPFGAVDAEFRRACTTGLGGIVAKRRDHKRALTDGSSVRSDRPSAQAPQNTFVILGADYTFVLLVF
jgi:hypothetical protein